MLHLCQIADVMRASKDSDIRRIQDLVSRANKRNNIRIFHVKKRKIGGHRGQKCLLPLQYQKAWILNSDLEWQKGHTVWAMIERRAKASHVGSEFRQAHHGKIFILRGIEITHIYFQKNIHIKAWGGRGFHCQSLSQLVPTRQSIKSNCMHSVINVIF